MSFAKRQYLQMLIQMRAFCLGTVISFCRHTVLFCVTVFPILFVFTSKFIASFTIVFYCKMFSWRFHNTTHTQHALCIFVFMSNLCCTKPAICHPNNRFVHFFVVNFTNIAVYMFCRIIQHTGFKCQHECQRKKYYYSFRFQVNGCFTVKLWLSAAIAYNVLELKEVRF